MARRCQFSGKRTVTGNSVSHSHKKTKRKWKPNLHTKKIFLPEENRWVKVKVSARALRTLTRKKNPAKWAKELGIKL